MMKVQAASKQPCVSMADVAPGDARAGKADISRRKFRTRRTFRCQTSDNMDKWKSTARKKLRQEESQKREEQRGRKSEERSCTDMKR